MDKDLRIDSELLISAIRKNECLWNKNTQEYHKKELKEISWNNICAELVEGWDSLKDQDKALKQLILKKRWNNIRDYYKKDLALQMKGDIGKPAMKRKVYMFSKKLEFLKPFYMERHRNSTVSDNDQEEEVEIREEDIKEETIEIYYSSGTEDNEPPPKKKPTSKTDLSSHHNWSFSASNSIAKEEEPTDVEELAESDCDLLFLKSLITDMKVLNHKQKIDFKLGILQLYKNIISQPENGGETSYYTEYHISKTS